MSMRLSLLLQLRVLPNPIDWLNAHVFWMSFLHLPGLCLRANSIVELVLTMRAVCTCFRSEYQ